MRKTMMAIITVLLAGAATLVGSAQAVAYDYPYCLQGWEVGIPGDCTYPSYAACMASASGRGLYCSINPRAAYGALPPRRAPRNYYGY